MTSLIPLFFALASDDDADLTGGAGSVRQDPPIVTNWEDALPRYIQRQHVHLYGSLRSRRSGGANEREIRRAVWRSSAFIGSLRREQTISGHTGCVNSVNWSDDGDLLVSAGDDCGIVISDFRNPTNQTVFPSRHTANIFCARFVPGKPEWLVTCSGDNQVRLFDVNTKQVLMVYEGHRDRVKKFVIPRPSSFGSMCVYSCSEDGTIKLIDMRARVRAAARPGNTAPSPEPSFSAPDRGSHYFPHWTSPAAAIFFRGPLRPQVMPWGPGSNGFYAGGPDTVAVFKHKYPSGRPSENRPEPIMSIAMAPGRPEWLVIGGDLPSIWLLDRRLLNRPPSAGRQSMETTPVAEFCPKGRRDCTAVTGVDISKDGKRVIGSWRGEYIYEFLVDSALENKDAFQDLFAATKSVGTFIHGFPMDGPVSSRTRSAGRTEAESPSPKRFARSIRHIDSTHRGGPTVKGARSRMAMEAGPRIVRESEEGRSTPSALRPPAKKMRKSVPTKAELLRRSPPRRRRIHLLSTRYRQTRRRPFITSPVSRGHRHETVGDSSEPSAPPSRSSPLRLRWELIGLRSRRAGTEAAGPPAGSIHGRPDGDPSDAIGGGFELRPLQGFSQESQLLLRRVHSSTNTSQSGSETVQDERSNGQGSSLERKRPRSWLDNDSLWTDQGERLSESASYGSSVSGGGSNLGSESHQSSDAESLYGRGTRRISCPRIRSRRRGPLSLLDEHGSDRSPQGFGLQRSSGSLSSSNDVGGEGVQNSPDSSSSSRGDGDSDRNRFTFQRSFSSSSSSESDPHDSPSERDSFSPRNGVSRSINAPVETPYSRIYKGHCNVRTIKEVQFLGPSSEWVASGSDDGRFFIWEARSGKLVFIGHNADSRVVNCIADHPTHVVLATAGIDSDAKLWAPGPQRVFLDRKSAAVASVLQNNERRRKTSSHSFEARHVWYL